ncbi:MAG: hypothetical protein QM704_26200 [Anaeromyxobacteraceae bacterium]
MAKQGSKVGDGMLVLVDVLPARGLMALAWLVGLVTLAVSHVSRLH